MPASPDQSRHVRSVTQHVPIIWIEINAPILAATNVNTTGHLAHVGVQRIDPAVENSDPYSLPAFCRQHKVWRQLA